MNYVRPYGPSDPGKGSTVETGILVVLLEELVFISTVFRWFASGCFRGYGCRGPLT
jgi:hypothetical protein